MYLLKILKNFFFTYPTPVNLSFLWNFGILSVIYFVIQVLTGIFISMHYISDGVNSFVSIEDFFYFFFFFFFFMKMEFRFFFYLFFFILVVIYFLKVIKNLEI